MSPKLTEETLRASVIAHTIRLGKCPRAGQAVDFLVAVKEIEREELAAFVASGGEGGIDKLPEQRASFVVTEEDLARGRALISAQRASFVVTEEDLARGRALISAQQAIYREPKTTLVPLGEWKP